MQVDSPFETGDETGLDFAELAEGHRSSRKSVCPSMELVEGVKKFFLRRCFPGKNVDIVDQKGIYIAIGLPKRLHRASECPERHVL